MKKYLLTLTALALAASAFAQPTSAASSSKPAAVETIDTDDHGAMPTQALTNPSTPAIEAITLQPAPAKQKITASPEVLAPSPMLPTAKVQVRKLPVADAARLSAAQRWEQTGVADALVGAGGAVEYPYGYSRPTITCAPLHVCSVALQDGEAATSVSIGDTVRWLLQTATAGAKSPTNT
jgi:type IV secretion system protein VirB9